MWNVSTPPYHKFNGVELRAWMPFLEYIAIYPSSNFNLSSRNMLLNSSTCSVQRSSASQAAAHPINALSLGELAVAYSIQFPRTLEWLII